MEADKVDKFLLANESKFPDYEIPIHRLLDLPPEKEAILAKNHFKRILRFGSFPDRGLG